jgi:hypothetical protein
LLTHSLTPSLTRSAPALRLSLFSLVAFLQMPWTHSVAPPDRYTQAPAPLVRPTLGA